VDPVRKVGWGDDGLTSKTSQIMHFGSEGLTLNSYTSPVNLNCNINYRRDSLNASGIWQFYVGFVVTTYLVLRSYIFLLVVRNCPQSL
jgi:hypothetical protein